MLTVDPKALLKAVDTEAGTNTLIYLRVDGEAALSNKVVMLKELQVHPVRRVPLHADLYEIRMDKVITVGVPLRLVGKAPGIDQGGIMDQGLQELRVECLPGSIPEYVEADVSELEMGDSIHVSDLTFPEGVKVIEDEATTVASVSAPAVEEEPEAVAEEEVAAGEEVAPAAEGEAPAEGAAPPAEGEAPAPGEKGGGRAEKK
jgi:large subunit ribosomal protein L25